MRSSDELVDSDPKLNNIISKIPSTKDRLSRYQFKQFKTKSKDTDVQTECQDQYKTQNLFLMGVASSHDYLNLLFYRFDQGTLPMQDYLLFIESHDLSNQSSSQLELQLDEQRSYNQKILLCSFTLEIDGINNLVMIFYQSEQFIKYHVFNIDQEQIQKQQSIELLRQKTSWVEYYHMKNELIHKFTAQVDADEKYHQASLKNVVFSDLQSSMAIYCEMNYNQ
ncbi:UNKNOWN [Stylonychia lemnae]|uniref:Uncharacterized protein n=1 Tax=Stylonychia lemnae TaxID=5949 RepID=A0A078APG8_STYLE|nr:UNKNOWN [Stylonychia lemnae]|eukprot:CDW83207.1 UNKNOWN [Stylonychia lemnae]